jgi:chromosome segregation ATPase
MNKPPKLLIILSALLLSSTGYLGFRVYKYQDEVDSYQYQTRNLSEQIDQLNDKLDGYRQELSECKSSLQSAQFELIRKNSFSSRTYINGSLTESYNSIEDAYDACKRKVSDLEDELRRCKNGW